MSHGKHGLRAFGLTIVAAFGLMAFMAVGAQANWLYLEGTTAVELTKNELVKVAKHTEDGTLEIEGINASVLCKKIEGEDLLLVPGNATTATATGSVAFSECVTLEKKSGLEQPKCTPENQPIKAAGKAKIVLHTNGQNYVLFEPEEGKPFTTIKFPETCALIETSNVTGSLVAECGELSGGAFVQEDCKNHQVSHLLQQASTELFTSDELKFGSHKASIKGIVSVELAGEHAKASWSGEV